MQSAKKIVVGKNDEPTLIAEKLIDTSADAVIFSIPRFSRFADSLSNFKLLKREAEVLDKQIQIESIDEEVLAHAAEAGIISRNPFLDERKKRFSDIVITKKTSASGVAIKPELDEEEDAEDTQPVSVSVNKKERPARKPKVEEVVEKEDKEIEEIIEGAKDELADWQKGEPTRPEKKKKRKKARRVRLPRLGFGFLKSKKAVFIILVLGLAATLYLGISVLPKAEATIVTKKEAWTFERGVMVNSSATEVNVEENTIPGQVFIKRDAMTMKFIANGKKFVERKATGELTIYNAHSSQSQPLVVNTRFQTPDGLIFRLKSGVVVPGAKISNGKVIPSSIDVDVIADKPGSDHNIGPLKRLTIPGFSDSDKADTFYGELKKGTASGFVGETQVPTEEDLNNAKAKSAKTIEDKLQSQLEGQSPAEFLILETATKFTIFKQAVDATVDADGKFTILTEAQLSALAFRETDLEALVSAELAKEKQDEYTIWEREMGYGTSGVQNPAAGEMTLPVEFKATLGKTIDVPALVNRIKDKSEDELRGIILGISGVENAQITLWPFWVKNVPNREGRIEITIE